MSPKPTARGWELTDADAEEVLAMSGQDKAAASLGGDEWDAVWPCTDRRVDLVFQVGIAIHCPLCGVLVEANTRHECSRLEEDAIERTRRLAK